MNAIGTSYQQLTGQLWFGAQSNPDRRSLRDSYTWRCLWKIYISYILGFFGIVCILLGLLGISCPAGARLLSSETDNTTTDILDQIGPIAEHWIATGALGCFLIPGVTAIHALISRNKEVKAIALSQLALLFWGLLYVFYTEKNPYVSDTARLNSSVPLLCFGVLCVVGLHGLTQQEPVDYDSIEATPTDFVTSTESRAII